MTTMLGPVEPIASRKVGLLRRMGQTLSLFVQQVLAFFAEIEGKWGGEVGAVGFTAAARWGKLQCQSELPSITRWLEPRRPIFKLGVFSPVSF